MRLPNSSNAWYVAFLRYVQSIHEPPERRNPDTLVRHFIPPFQRWRTAWLGPDALLQLRSDPFYSYLIARTRYYDQVFLDAIAGGVRQIIGVGCGSDTRAYRFRQALIAGGVHVLECDQPDAIKVKRRVARRWRASDYVEYLAIDLNDKQWPQLTAKMNHTGHKVLLMLEGVSPYVNESNFAAFLGMAAQHLAAGSLVAYDYKLRGVKEDFGRTGRTHIPFRMSALPADVAAFHENLHLRLEHCELSSDLSARLLPDLRESRAALFEEDGLARLTVEP
jgi:methyltransferase (TIGR00027 family)